MRGSKAGGSPRSSTRRRLGAKKILINLLKILPFSLIVEVQNDISFLGSSEHVTISNPIKAAPIWHPNGYGQRLNPAPNLADDAQSQRSGLAYLCAKFKRLSDFDKGKQICRFRRIYTKTLNKLPKDAVDLISRYWKSKEAENQEMYPRLVLSAAFATSAQPGTEVSPAAAVNKDGTEMYFSLPLVFAPDKVLEEAFAHELGHVFFLAGGEWPAVEAISEDVRKSYRHDEWAEEQAVRTQIEKWNFTDELLDIWKAAVDLGQGDWKRLYTEFITLLKTRRQEKTS